GGRVARLPRPFDRPAAGVEKDLAGSQHEGGGGGRRGGREQPRHQQGDQQRPEPPDHTESPPERYAAPIIDTSCATASSRGANGPGRKCGDCSPRCTDSQAAQSCRLVMSQNSTAPGAPAAAAEGSVSHEHSTQVRPGASGTIRCVIT